VRLGKWVYTDFIPDDSAKNLYLRLVAHCLTARLGVGDLWAEARKPAAGLAVAGRAE
jgi:hypothetical protein